jgi:hypothetical protein
MNIVDLLKDQLTGEVGKKLSGMAGASESDLGKILGAGLPSVLSGLGSVASTKAGADKLAEAIGGMDSKNMGDIGKMLGGNALSSGGGMLSNLLGGTAVDGVAAAISKFTGVNLSIVKTVLGYLAPMILGSVGASFKGTKPDGAAISKLFSEQKSNIAAAMPSGFSLDAVPGLSGLASSVSKGVQQSQEQVSGGLNKFIVPGAILAVLAGLAAVFFNTGKTPKDETKDPVSGALKKLDDVKTDITEKVKKEAGKLPDVESLAKDGIDSMSKTISSTLGGLTTQLEGIQDAASADAALPALEKSLSAVEGYSKGLSALPAEGKSMISKLVATQLEKLNPIIEKISAIPGIGDSVKQILEKLKAQLTSMVG